MIWRALLSLVPTAALQAALAARGDVEAHDIAPGAQRTFKLCGPAVVTVKRGRA